MTSPRFQPGDLVRSILTGRIRRVVVQAGHIVHFAGGDYADARLQVPQQEPTR